MLLFFNLCSNLIATNQGSLDKILNPFKLYTLPLVEWINSSVNYIVDNYRPFFQAIRLPIAFTLESIQWFLLSIPPLIFLILLGLLAWQIAGGRIAIYSVVALSLIGFLGAWQQAIVSLSLVVTAAAFCLLVGILIGILSASNQRLEKWLRPLLDAMQTMPSFVYLVPVVMLFGIGKVSGVIATFIFAVPPVIRLTSLGIRQVSEELVEAAIAFGSTPRQILWEIQIPLAMPTILTGVNQAILLALSMSVVTSMIGVEGLGGMVLRGLGQLNVGLASVGGLSIVLIAVMLDRMTNVFNTNSNQVPWKQRGFIGLFTSKSKFPKITFATFGASILSVLLIASITKQPISTTSSGKVMPGQDVTVQSAHSTLQEERFQTEIVNIGLRKLGYETPEPKRIEFATMFVALGNGDLQYTPTYWPKAHQVFFEKGGGEEKLEKVGLLTPNTLQGYQIDKKTADKYNITSLAQLKDPEIAKLFDFDGDGKANLTGCNSGWSCELTIQHQIKAYGLEDTVKQDRGNYSALIVDTITRQKQGEPVLYYTWTPMWMSAVLKLGKDVVWLDVPFTSLPESQKDLTEKDTSFNGKNLGFAVDTIRILANQEFVDSNPAAKRFFELIQIPIDDINVQNQLFKEGEGRISDVRGHAQEWVKNNQVLFDSWVEEARKYSEDVSSS
ncbi:glycine betaine/L-proline ABC transporter substrate-binding protein ProX [Nodularia harveyana UHCC-0300]|uniref:Glycine betaine/L-proline ABC transporter substrate-binding protein ProX n=1 Tax=Nodularia harveyana UHCC-0300 TaxID=2974287 RepID=A0ABU5UK82_9CYAN|nr:glycine betaine/L-proline ABC transporter substrate-binding protein ProX [Nodularia harveyana]MEA5583356.1 glycine betaine/L-proline ABC transporter substrate-binding protein ProX [Nodularia harveyana UHCC-0300]